MSTSVVKSTDRDPPFAAVSEKFAGLTLIRFRFFPLAKASDTISTVEPESANSEVVPSCLPCWDMFTIILGVFAERHWTVPSYSIAGLSGGERFVEVGTEFET